MSATYSQSDVFNLTFEPPSVGSLRDSTAEDYRLFWVPSPSAVPPDAMVTLRVQLPSPFECRVDMSGVVLDTLPDGDGAQGPYQVCVRVLDYCADDLRELLRWVPQRRPADRSVGAIAQRVVHVERIRCYSGLLMQEFDATILDICQDGAFLTSEYWFVRDEMLKLGLDQHWVPARVMWHGEKYSTEGVGVRVELTNPEHQRGWISRLLHGANLEERTIH